MILDLALVALLILSFLVAMVAICVLLYSFVHLLSTIQDKSRSEKQKLVTSIFPFLLFAPEFQPPEKHKHIKRFLFSLFAFLISFGLGLFIQSTGGNLK